MTVRYIKLHDRHRVVCRDEGVICSRCGDVCSFDLFFDTTKFKTLQCNVCRPSHRNALQCVTDLSKLREIFPMHLHDYIDREEQRRAGLSTSFARDTPSLLSEISQSPASSEEDMPTKLYNEALQAATAASASRTAAQSSGTPASSIQSAPIKSENPGKRKSEGDGETHVALAHHDRVELREYINEVVKSAGEGDTETCYIQARRLRRYMEMLRLMG